MATATFSAKDLATECGAPAKVVRKFLRSHFAENELDTPGQGGRYVFTKGEVTKLSKAFAAWSSAKPTPKAAKASQVIEDDEEDLDLVEDFDDAEADLPETGPSDEDLEDLEDLEVSEDDEADFEEI